MMDKDPQDPPDTPPAEPAPVRPEPVEDSPGPARPEPVEGLRQPSPADPASAHPEPPGTHSGPGESKEPAAASARPEALVGRAGDDTTPEQQLAKAREDAAKYLTNWQRAEADFQNYKRRAEQERDESRRFSHASLIINLLPILDDFERAFGSLDIRLAGLTWLDGMRLIYRKLQALLDSAGVTPIQTEGQPFDPRFHEAVAHADGEEGKVLSEVQRGYKLHDRVLRPAMVVVGKGQQHETGDKQQEDEPKEEPSS